jgi:hypothetical protein
MSQRFLLDCRSEAAAAARKNERRNEQVQQKIFLHTGCSDGSVDETKRDGSARGIFAINSYQ